MSEWLVHHELERQAAWRPSKIAVWFEESEWTYNEFNSRVNRIAQFLRSSGLIPGDVVVTHAKNHPDLYALFFACSKAGLIYSPISTFQSERNVKYICDELSPAAVCYTDDEEICEDSLDTVRSYAPQARYLCLDLGSETKDDSLESVSEDYPESNPSWSLAQGQDTTHNIFWTSGTTGRPKGVVRNHRSTLRFSDPLTEHLSFDESMRRLIHNDMMFVAPYLSEGLPTVMGGGTFYILRQFSAADVADFIDDHDITDIHISFTKTQLLLDYVKESDVSLQIPRVQAALPNAETATKLANHADTLYHSYATTEVGRPVATEVKPPFDERPPIGKPGRSVDVRVVTTDERGVPSRKLPERGETGELAIKGDVTMTRYLREENQEKLVHDGWVFPGDMAQLNEDNELVFMGRKDDRIRSGGINIYPSEIEQAVSSHSDVGEAVAIGVDDETWGDRVCCLVVTERENTEQFEQELDEHCRNTGDLADEVRPKEYVFLSSSEEIPTSAVNKVDRAEVQSYFE